MNDLKHMLFNSIVQFNQTTEPTIDWTVVLEDDTKFETIIDAIDTLIDGVALLPDIEDLQRIHLLGRLALIRSHLSYCYVNEQQIAHFIQHGQRLEKLLKDIINCSNWLINAQQRFDEYLEFEEMATEDTILTPKQIDQFRPVLMALAIMGIISIEEDECAPEDLEEENDYE